MAIDGLVVWLSAQLDEDERVARAAADGDSGRWFVGDHWNVYRVEDEARHDEDYRGEENRLVVYGNVFDQSEHIAANDPARVLAEVATKRWLIDEIIGELGDDAEQQMVQLRLQHMALPYAGRPGYDEAWRPEA